jgi:hypothetical protein
MKKLILKILILLSTFCIILLCSFYYEFFLKPPRDAEFNDYSTTLNITNNTRTRKYVVLNHDFSENEIKKYQKESRYLSEYSFFLTDTILLVKKGDFPDNTKLPLSGFFGKPDILPEDFSLSILDSTKKVIKKYDGKVFLKEFKFYGDECVIEINCNGDVISVKECPYIR